MAGLLDIKSIYADLPGIGQTSPQGMLQQQRGGIAGLVDNSLSRLQSRLPGRAFQATGNNQFLTPQQRMTQLLSTIDPSDPQAGEKLLAAARKDAPSMVPGILDSIEKRQQQIRAEEIQDAQENREAKRLGIDERRATAYIDNLKFQEENSRIAQRQQWARIGLDSRQVAIAESNMSMAQEEARRDAIEFARGTSDRVNIEESKERLAGLLEAKEMPVLAEAARSPDSSINTVIQAMVQEDSIRVRQFLEEQRLTAEGLVGTPPTESDTDSFVVASLQDAPDGNWVWGKGMSEAERSNLLRTFYVNGGYMLHRQDPVAAKAAAYRYLERYKAVMSDPRNDEEEEEEVSAADAALNSPTSGQVVRRPLGSFNQ